MTSSHGRWVWRKSSFSNGTNGYERPPLTAAPEHAPAGVPLEVAVTR